MIYFTCFLFLFLFFFNVIFHLFVSVCVFPKPAIESSANGVPALGVLCSTEYFDFLCQSTKSLPEETLVKTSFRGPP